MERSVGDGTLLPVAKTVKQNRGEKSLCLAASPRGAVIQVPRNAPAHLLPAGQKIAVHLPDVAHAPDVPRTALVAVEIELIRPVRPDGTAAVQWHRVFDPQPGDGRGDLVLARLEWSQPYEVKLDGRPVLSDDGNGWAEQPRAVVTIRATSTPALLALLGVVTPVRAADGYTFLSVPIVHGQLHEVWLDGVRLGEQR